MDSNCIFCKILNGDVPSQIIHRDEKCVVFMDIQPVNPGHLLIVPIKHYSFVSDVPDDVVSHMMLLGKKMGIKLRKSQIKCEGVNFFLADGEAAMQEVMHSHLHVFPRYAGDGFGLKFSPDYYNKPPWDSIVAVGENLKSIN